LDDLKAAGMVFSGQSGNRMEILELPDHPYFVGTQFHPEFRSRPTRASPPFVGLLDAALDRQAAERHEAADPEEVEL
jgi:CTP synthase